jgi:nucleotide-binding universal stress UspA family protein
VAGVVARTLQTAPRPRLAYRRIVVPLAGDDDSELGIALAAELAPEGGAAITAVVVIEVAAELPLDAHMHDEEVAARAALDKAHAIAASRGVRLRARVVRARARGEAIVAEAEAADADLIVVRASRQPGTGLFGKTVDYVLRHASCRVLVLRP